MPTPTGRMTAKEKRDAALANNGAKTAQIEKNGGVTDVEKLNRTAMANPGAVPDAHGQIAQPSVAGAKVIVACKIGVPYIDLQLCEMVEVSEETQTGSRRKMQARRTGSVVRIRGTAYPRGSMPSEFPAPPIMAGGAALNFGIDKDWFDAWLEQNKRSALVINGLIFAHESEDMVRGRALEQASILSGLEPINPKGDPRIRAFAKSTREEVSDVETRSRKAG